MITYSQFRPTQFDTKGLGLSDRQDWLVAPVIRTRDSGPFENSNFDAFLSELGGESDFVEVHSFNHWGPGWLEIILIDPRNSMLVEKAEELEGALENYPVLDEEDLSKREWELMEESWELYGRKEFLRGVSKLLSGISDDSDHGFSIEEIEENLDLLTDDQVDCLWDNATKKLGWVFETESDSTRFNDKGALEEVNPWEVVQMVDEALWEKKTKDDIRRLCSFLGVPQLADKAVESKAVLVSQIRKLAVA